MGRTEFEKVLGYILFRALRLSFWIGNIMITLGDFIYKANEHTDAVEAVDMLHIVEYYYNEDK